METVGVEKEGALRREEGSPITVKIVGTDVAGVERFEREVGDGVASSDSVDTVAVVIRRVLSPPWHARTNNEQSSTEIFMELHGMI